MLRRLPLVPDANGFTHRVHYDPNAGRYTDTTPAGRWFAVVLVGKAWLSCGQERLSLSKAREDAYENMQAWDARFKDITDVRCRLDDMVRELPEYT